MNIELTADEAEALYRYLEDPASPNWWETPLAPLHEPLRDHHRYESEL